MDTTYAFYHDGDSTIETRNGSSYVLKQQVWGTQYIDELVQIGVNQDPANASTSITEARRENECERFFWACQDSNYNVLGVLYATGALAERYEYTPYGKRTVYSRGWLLGDLDDDGSAATSADQTLMTGQFGTSDPASRADLDGDGDVDLDDFTAMAAQSGLSIAAADPLVHHPRHGSFRGRMSAGNPAVLCEFGHQGLQHDEEYDLVYNRARMLIPFHGRFGGRDPLEYADSFNLSEYLASNPVVRRDPTGKGIACTCWELVTLPQTPPNWLCGAATSGLSLPMPKGAGFCTPNHWYCVPFCIGISVPCETFTWYTCVAIPGGFGWAIGPSTDSCP